MSYSSYIDYLKYKNCKRDTIPCNNNFESYNKYTRSLACCRAWWTNDDIRKLNAVTPCKMCLPPPKLCCATSGSTGILCDGSTDTVPTYKVCPFTDEYYNIKQ
jgi:hypothetical protein